MLEIGNLNQYYGESHTLRDLSLHVEAGSCTCVMGRNGVGKTTLVKTIMGEIPARSGRITFQKTVDLRRRSLEDRSRLGIGYVPQGRQIFPLLSVEENLMTGLPVRRDKARQVPDRIYDLFPVLKDMRHRLGGDLSGGQQQQLAIGRALVVEPRLLILDEPGEGIQPNIVAEIGELIVRLNTEEGLSVLLIEQKLPFVRKYAQKFVLMERGHAEASGEIADLNDALIERHLHV